MATVTHLLASFENDTCAWSYDYDDVTFKLISLRCRNDTTKFQSEGKLWPLVAGVPQEPPFVQLVNPSSDVTQNIPQSVINRFNIAVDSRGRLTGIDHAFRMLPA